MIGQWKNWLGGRKNIESKVARQNLVNLLERISKGLIEVVGGIDINEHNPQRPTRKKETLLYYEKSPEQILKHIQRNFPFEASETGTLYGPKVIRKVYPKPRSIEKAFEFYLENISKTKYTSLSFTCRPKASKDRIYKAISGNLERDFGEISSLYQGSYQNKN